MTRREFVVGAAGGLLTTLLASVPRALATLPAGASGEIRALAFDALAIFDPRPVFALADEMFPGSGLSDEWRTRQFEYTWLRVAAQHYADFWQVTEDALVFATSRLRLTLSPDDRAALMNAYLELKAWPDVASALESLIRSGFRLALLSNFTPQMLDANIHSAGLDGLFEQAISTDRSRTYKPAPRAYQLGLDGLKAVREEVLFVAFAGWDAAGAKLFGYPTYWVNRQHSPAEDLGVVPDGSGETLTDLTKFLA
jgi:2-haloacid dehalogenase